MWVSRFSVVDPLVVEFTRTTARPINSRTGTPFLYHRNWAAKFWCSRRYCLCRADEVVRTKGSIRLVPLLVVGRIRPRQRLDRQRRMGAAEIRHGRILADVDDA